MCNLYGLNQNGQLTDLQSLYTLLHNFLILLTRGRLIPTRHYYFPHPLNSFYRARPLPPRQSLPLRILHPLKKLGVQEAFVVACREDDAVIGEEELDAGGEGGLDVDVDEYLGGGSHSFLSGIVGLVDRGEGEEREEERTAYYAVMPWQTLCEVDMVSFHF